MTARLATPARPEAAMLESLFDPDGAAYAVALVALERASQGVYPTPVWLSAKTGQPKRVCRAVIQVLEQRGILGAMPPREGGKDG